MAAHGPDGVWDDAARQAASQPSPAPDYDPQVLAEEIGRIVERFLKEVWGRHRRSLEEILARPRPNGTLTVGLGDSSVEMIVVPNGGYSFKTFVAAVDFCVQSNGLWRYSTESADDYVPSDTLLGYTGLGEFVATPNLRYCLSVTPSKLPRLTADLLVGCVYAEW
ncbi:MAG TPA: hypothetical protein VLA88_06655 [Candidatus Saccharimonadales bacterium]|nr:hypothetical protein [Candidatus Saccharimonadales bacterium]